MSKLSILADYYFMRRRVGHTSAMLNGARSDKNIIVVVAHKAQMNYIELPKEQMITIGELDKLRGLKKPVLVDHLALQTMFYELNKELNNKDEIIKELLKKIEHIKLFRFGKKEVVKLSLWKKILNIFK